MNRKQISSTIRNISRADKKKCSICNSRKNVQCHHIIKVEDLTHIAWQNNMQTREELEQLYIPTIDLCNECHVKFHSLMEDNYLEPQITYDDFIKVLDVLSSIDLLEAPEELLEDYSIVVENMTNTVIFNLLQFGEFTEEELEEIEKIIEKINNIRLLKGVELDE